MEFIYLVKINFTQVVYYACMGNLFHGGRCFNTCTLVTKQHFNMKVNVADVPFERRLAGPHFYSKYYYTGV